MAESSDFSPGRGRGLVLACALVALAAFPASALEARIYDVAIVVDIVRPKFQEIIDGFKSVVDARLERDGARAEYRIYDTKTNPATVPAILDALRARKPDLVFVVNSPDAFADRNVSLKLTDPSYRIVSENCIPVQSGVAKEWTRPGGNITGVGVFVQMTSLIKLAKLINPGYRKLVLYGWDRMKDINAWFLADLTAACRAEGIELAEVKWVASAEDEFELYLRLDKLGPECFGIEAISAWVHRDGSYADMSAELPGFIRKNVKRFATFAYDEAAMREIAPAGTCVEWKDLGAQLGEKALRVLGGAKPGDISWDYPRKYNIVLNVAAAKSLGLTVPPSIISAAYRVYTDFDGNFVGRKD